MKPNPCKECIVRSMCKTCCGNYTNYIYGALLENNLTTSSISSISFYIRSHLSHGHMLWSGRRPYPKHPNPIPFFINYNEEGSITSIKI